MALRTPVALPSEATTTHGIATTVSTSQHALFSLAEVTARDAGLAPVDAGRPRGHGGGHSLIITHGGLSGSVVVTKA